MCNMNLHYADSFFFLGHLGTVSNFGCLILIAGITEVRPDVRLEKLQQDLLI